MAAKSPWKGFEKNSREYLLGIDPGKLHTGLAIVSHFKGYDVKVEKITSMKTPLKTFNTNLEGTLSKEKEEFKKEFQKLLRPYTEKLSYVMIERYQGRHRGGTNEIVNAVIFFLFDFCEDLFKESVVCPITSSNWKNALRRWYGYEKGKVEGELVFPNIYYNPTKTRIKKEGLLKEVVLEHPLDAVCMCLYFINSCKTVLNKKFKPVSRIIYENNYHYLQKVIE